MSTIKGIGTDIIENKRIQEAIERHGERFLERLFTPKEREYCSRYKYSLSHFAGRFAAKEAITKALGTGIKDIQWLDIEILNNKEGQPFVILSPRLQAMLQKNVRFLVSISHCDEYTTATAIFIEEASGDM